LRELLYTALINIPEYNDVDLLLGDEGRADRVRVYQWGALGSDDIPEVPKFPFVVVFENPSVVNQEVQETARSQNRFFQVYCYDERMGGYTRIEHVLRLARDTVLGLPMQVSPSGARCTDAKWLGFSSDSRDPEYNANLKFMSVKLTASQ
jgi:hypothetical protein